MNVALLVLIKLKDHDFILTVTVQLSLDKLQLTVTIYCLDLCLFLPIVSESGYHLHLKVERNKIFVKMML